MSEQQKSCPRCGKYRTNEWDRVCCTCLTQIEQDMMLMDRFACASLQGYRSRGTDTPLAPLVQYCYTDARAMLAERKRIMEDMLNRKG